MQHKQGDGLGLPRIPHAFVAAASPAARFSSLAPLTVFRAPRGWGKTATAAAWLRSLGPEYEFIWVSVREDMTAEEFWSVVHQRLADLDLDLDLTEHTRCEQLLTEREVHLVLVVDNLHLLADESVDDALVDAVVHVTRLHVMALSRVERRIEMLAPIEADGLVFRVQHLRLSVDEVRQVAAELGSELTVTEAEELTRSVGGWPALVRATFAGPLGQSESAEVIGSYLQVVLRDPLVQDVVREAMPMALAAELDEETVRLLEPGLGLEEALRPLVEAGLAGRDGHLPPVVRAALTHLYTEIDPQGAAQTHARLARWYEQKEDSPRALEHALGAHDEARCRRILQDDWLRLGDHPTLVEQAVAVLGSPSMDADPRTYVLSRYSGAAAGSAHLLVGSPTAEVAQALPATLVQWGLARLGVGDLPGGEDALRDALSRAETLGQQESTQHAIAALAFARAVAGAVIEAKEWLQACRTDLPETAGLIRVARQFVALDSLALEEDETLWPQLSPLSGEVTGGLPTTGTLPRRLDLLEASITAARALHLGATGMEYSRMLEIQLRGLAGAENALARMTVVKTIATMMLADNRLERCKALLLEEPGVNPVERWLRTRLGFYGGDLNGVLTTSDPATVDRAVIPPRILIEMLLVRACTLKHLERWEDAADSLHDAVVMAKTYGLIRPFLLVPRADLEAIGELVPRFGEFFAQPALAGRASLFGAPAPVVELSRGELRVLEAIAEGQPVVAVASRLFVSSNTVKTQLRAIYRKLGVHDRRQAVERARELRLLPEEPESAAI